MKHRALFLTLVGLVACVGTAKALRSEGGDCADSSDCYSTLVCGPTHRCEIPDAGPPDATIPDAGAADVTPPEAGVADVGPDAPVGPWCQGSEVPCVFVTSTTSVPPADVAAADTRCNDFAHSTSNKQDLGGTWTAWFSASSGSVDTHARDRVLNRIGAEFQFVRASTAPAPAPARVRFTISDSTILPSTPISFDELGNGVSGTSSLVWTGTTANGTYGDGATCSQSGESFVRPIIGIWGSTTETWTTDWVATNACPSQARLYCFQTSPTTP